MSWAEVVREASQIANNFFFYGKGRKVDWKKFGVKKTIRLRRRLFYEMVRKRMFE